MTAAVRPAFRDVYERTGIVHHDEKMPEREKVEALTRELVESGFLKGREYKSAKFGNYSLYAFQIGEQYADILLLHVRDASLDSEFGKGFVKLLNTFGEREVEAPAWDFPQEVIDNIIKNNKYTGELEV